MIALGRNHATNARVRQNVVIQSVRQARDWSQVFSFSGSQDSSHSPVRAGAWDVLIVCLLGQGRVAEVGQRVVATAAVVSRLRASSGDSWCSIRTTVRCIQTKQVPVSRKRTKKVEVGKPDHTLVYANSSGSTKPPRPPNMPTRPPTEPTLSGKYSGMCL